MSIEIPTYPGMILEELLEDRKLTQKDLSIRINSSEKHVSNIINGKAKLSLEMAQKLEIIFDDYPASLWNNLELRYREALLLEEYIVKIYEDKNIDEIAKRFKFKEIFPKVDIKLAAFKMLKLLGITCFDNFHKVYHKQELLFMKDKGEFISQVIWLRIAQKQILQQNDYIEKPFISDTLSKRIEGLRELINIDSFEIVSEELRKDLSEMGIYLCIVPNITKSSIRGALEKYDDHPVIYLTKRFKTHDHFWFALIHELGHILNGDFECIIDYDSNGNELEIDIKANEFARDFLVDKTNYEVFVSERKFTKQRIEVFSNEISTLPGIVVGRLQHDGYIKPSEFNYLKLKI